METIDYAVRSLSRLIEAAGSGYWLIDATSGVRPEDITSLKHNDVLITRPQTRVEYHRGLVDEEMLKHAVYAVSAYVRQKVG